MEEQVNAVLREKNALQEQVKNLGEKPVATVVSCPVISAVSHCRGEPEIRTSCSSVSDRMEHIIVL